MFLYKESLYFCRHCVRVDIYCMWINQINQLNEKRVDKNNKSFISFVFFNKALKFKIKRKGCSLFKYINFNLQVNLFLFNQEIFTFTQKKTSFKFNKLQQNQLNKFHSCIWISLLIYTFQQTV